MGSARLSSSTPLLAAALAALGSGAGCRSNEAPETRVAADHELATTPLTSLADVRLDRVGSDFALIAFDAKADAVRFARLGASGALGPETVLKLPSPRVSQVGPWFALAGRDAPGDQLAVVYGAPSGSSPGKIELTLITMDAGAAAPNGATPLLDASGMPVTVLTAPTDLRASMATSTSGRLAAFTWGYVVDRSTPPAPKIVVIKPGGEVAAAPMEVKPPKTWDCLALVPSLNEFAISTVQHSGSGPRPLWYMAEIGADGHTKFILTVELNTRDMGCPFVATTAVGYTLAWQNTDGTYFASMDTSFGAANIPVNVQFIKGAVRWGGPDKQPPVAGVAFMGRDYAIAYATDDGPQIDLFDVFGSARGGPLFLPSRGRPGPVSGWAGVGALYVTYLDRAGDDAGDAKRYFIQVVPTADVPDAGPRVFVRD